MELSIREQMLASVSGAGITALTMTPFDVVKGTFTIFTSIYRGSRQRSGGNDPDRPSRRGNYFCKCTGTTGTCGYPIYYWISARFRRSREFSKIISPFAKRLLEGLSGFPTRERSRGSLIQGSFDFPM